MSRAARIASAALLLAAPLAAQRPAASRARLQELLARAESLVAADSLRNEGERQALVNRRQATVWRGRALAVVLWNAVPPGHARAIVAGAESLLAAFAVVPEPVQGRLVVIQEGVTRRAQVLGEHDLAGRDVAVMEWFWDDRQDTSNATWLIARAVTRAYAAGLPAEWQAWLKDEFGLLWTGREGLAAMGSLAETDIAAGQACLAGRSRSCELWLGIDEGANPYTERYTPAELRRQLSSWTWRQDPERAACTAGDDVACIRYAARERAVEPAPAPPLARASLVRAVRDLYGAAAVQLAFADTVGPLAARLSSAARVSRDSLMTAWRGWVLRRGRPDRVRLGTGQVLTSLLAAAACLALAMRSGRWR